jgi:hypothetical protein
VISRTRSFRHARRRYRNGRDWLLESVTDSHADLHSFLGAKNFDEPVKMPFDVRSPNSPELGTPPAPSNLILQTITATTVHSASRNTNPVSIFLSAF